VINPAVKMIPRGRRRSRGESESDIRRESAVDVFPSRSTTSLLPTPFPLSFTSAFTLALERGKPRKFPFFLLWAGMPCRGLEGVWGVDRECVSEC
jgi:hypothetical protein